MHNLNLTDETFDVNQSGNYFLLLQSSLNGFSYAICDSVRNKCILLKHFEAQCADWFEFGNFLKPIIDTEPNLKLTFKKVHHILVQKDFTVLPETFTPQNENDFHKFYPGVNLTANTIKASRSALAQSTILSPYPNDLMEVLQANFNGIQLSHVTLPFVNQLLNDSAHSLRHVFHVMVYDNFTIIGVAHSSKLEFLNSFSTNTFEEMFYYLVSVLEKHKTSPHTAEISLQNNTSIPGLVDRLQTYTGKVRILKASTGIVFSYVFTEDILERFVNLINLYHCE